MMGRDVRCDDFSPNINILNLFWRQNFQLTILSILYDSFYKSLKKAKIPPHVTKGTINRQKDTDRWIEKFKILVADNRN